MTLTQALACVLAYSMAVAGLYDLVFCRPERRARRAAEAHAHQLQDELERRDRGDMVRNVAPISGFGPLTEGRETGSAQIVPLRSRPGPRRRSRAAHPSNFHREGA